MNKELNGETTTTSTAGEWPNVSSSIDKVRMSRLVKFVCLQQGSFRKLVGIDPESDPWESR